MRSLYDRAAIIPGRSMTRSKAPDRLRTAWADRGCGAYVYDTEHRTYLDFVCGLGAISLGYKQTDGWRHGVFSLPHRVEIDAAEAVLEHVAPWASSARFVKSGSEATHAAYRIAKKATGRPLVLKGDWAYHGWHEWTETCPTFPLWYDFGTAGSFTVNGPAWSHTVMADAVAAIFIEPTRFEPLNLTWLRHVREWCDRTGALLVFDEMIWGGRHTLGGCSEYAGVTPDLACYGKAFGNGEAVAFVVGNDALREHGEIVSGTFAGDVTGLSSVIETLRVYTSAPVIDTIWQRGQQLGDGLKAVIPETIAIIEGYPPLQRIRFHHEGHREQFKDAMHAKGILTYPDWFMVSYAHTSDHIAQAVDAAAQSVTELR